jgi:hypothetical protein
MNLSGKGFPYIRLSFSLMEGYEYFGQETVHLLVRLLVYNYDKIISVH